MPDNLPGIGGDIHCEISYLFIAYITVHYSAVGLVRM